MTTDTVLLDVSALTPGMRVRCPIGLCTVAKPLTVANRGGQQIGYRLRLTGPDGSPLAAQVVKFGTLLNVVREGAVV